MEMTHKDFLAICKRMGRDPKTVKRPASYMRGWRVADERFRRKRERS